MKNEDRLFLIIGLVLLIVAIITSARAAHAEEREITDAEVLAKVMYTEARGVDSKTEQAAVAWCVLNRVDHEDYPDTVRDVVTQQHQFAWDSEAPVTDELLTLAQDVLLRWELEKLGMGDVGRVLPKEYIFFAAKNGRNRFRASFRGSSYYWDWAVESPYEMEKIQ